jgi:hypothetical protein
MATHQKSCMKQTAPLRDESHFSFVSGSAILVPEGSRSIHQTLTASKLFVFIEMLILYSQG